MTEETLSPSTNSGIVITSFGSDPEFFLRDKETLAAVSSLGIIPGEKQAPYLLTDLGEGYSLQKDNVLLEFCVPPTNNIEDLWDSINKAKNYVQDNMLPDNLEIIAASGMEFSPDQLDNDYARTFGCSPSYNAWTLRVNFTESNKTNYRSAGFHLHFGYDDNDPLVSAELVKFMDLFLGIPSVLFDDDAIRRKQYGQAGEFRITDFGFEYRSLGGYVMTNKDYFKAAVQGVNRAIDLYNEGKTFTDEESLEIQLAINTNNIGLAEKYVEEYKMVEDIISKVLVVE